MTKKRGGTGLSNMQKNIAIGLLALIAVVVGVIAFRPGPTEVTPEMVAEGKAAVAELKAERKARAIEAAEAAAALPDGVVIGDSMSAGSDNTAVWPDLVAEQLGFQLEMQASGGSAYTQKRKPFADQAKAISLKSPEVIIVAGSVNDRTADPDELTDAAAELLSNLKSDYPEAEIVAIGPIAASTSTMKGLDIANTAVKNAAARSEVTYWDALGDAWLPNMNLIQKDNLHPTDEGHEALAAIIGKRLIEAGIFKGQ